MSPASHICAVVMTSCCSSAHFSDTCWTYGLIESIICASAAPPTLPMNAVVLSVVDNISSVFATPSRVSLTVPNVLAMFLTAGKSM